MLVGDLQANPGEKQILLLHYRSSSAKWLQRHPSKSFNRVFAASWSFIYNYRDTWRTVVECVTRWNRNISLQIRVVLDECLQPVMNMHQVWQTPSHSGTTLHYITYNPYHHPIGNFSCSQTGINTYFPIPFFRYTRNYAIAAAFSIALQKPEIMLGIMWPINITWQDDIISVIVSMILSASRAAFDGFQLHRTQQ